MAVRQIAYFLLHSRIDFAPNHVALIPTQIYSSVLDFLHFGILLYIARHKKKDGQVVACYLIFTASAGLSLEFFRGG